MIEKYYKASSDTWLHRCRECLGIFYSIYKIPAYDNGFVNLQADPHMFEFCSIKRKITNRIIA